MKQRLELCERSALLCSGSSVATTLSQRVTMKRPVWWGAHHRFIRESLRNYSRGTYEKTKSGISREYGFRQTIADRPLLAVPLAADPLPGARGYCPPQVWSAEGANAPSLWQPWVAKACGGHGRRLRHD